MNLLSPRTVEITLTSLFEIIGTIFTLLASLDKFILLKSFIFMLSLFVIPIAFTRQVHELGHAKVAQLLSGNEIRTECSINHTKFKNIENQPNWVKRLIALSGTIAELSFYIFSSTAYTVLLPQISSLLIKHTYPTSEKVTIIAWVPTMLLSLFSLLFNLFPSKKKRNDGYLFLHPDQICDEL